MPIITKNDFNSVLEAVQLRGALIAADQRSSKQHSGSIEGFGVYTGLNHAFAANLIGPGKIVTLPKQVSPGVLIEFGDAKKGKSAFGLVIEPPTLAPAEQVFVTPLDQSQVNELLTQNPDTQKVLVNEQEVKQQHPLDTTPSVVSFNNPIDKLFFGVLKDGLYKLTGSHSAEELLVWVYIGAVVIGIMGMVLVFWRGNS